MRVLLLIFCLTCACLAYADDLVVSEWLVLGTVPFEKDVDPFDEPVPADLLDEGPDDGDAFEGMRWTASPATDEGHLDLIDRGLDPEEFCSAYLHAYVFSPETGSATLSVGSDDGIQVFVNGTEVHRNWTLRGFEPNQDEFPVRLGSGWNRLLLRVANYSGGFGASAAVLAAGRLASVATRPPDYVAVRTPPWLDLVGSRPGPRLVPDEEGGLALKMTSELRNLGTDVAADVVLRVASTDGNVDSAARFVIPPGRSELVLPLDPERVARSVAAGAGLRLRLEHDGHVGTDEVPIDAGVRDVLGIVTGEPTLRDRMPVGSESIARLLKSWRWGRRFRPDLFENEDGFRVLLTAYLDEDDRTFGQQWGNLRHEMKRGAEAIRAQRITFVGNSHIDMAWLWDREETKEVVELTYDQALKFIDEFSFFNYAQSQMQTYAWVETSFPEMMRRMDDAVKAGRWIPVGGMWVEPDCNLPSGESFVRQLLHGKGWIRDRWGIDIRLGWNPDSFGYAATLPMIFKGAGIDYFITQKIGWNDTTEFPHRLFWWEAPDGSRVLSYFPFTYVDDARPDVLAERLAHQREQQPGLDDVLNLYGVGDHGGGPTREMIERYVEMSEVETFPVVEHAHPREFMERVERKYRGKIPVWTDELYLEYHRGTFTTQGEVKRRNRRMESSLETAEKFASIAATLVPGYDYPVAELDGAWSRTLFNQFHDILPGSSIPEVYVDAHADYDEAEALVDSARAGALDALAGMISTNTRKGVPVVVFNPLSWGRSGTVCVRLDAVRSDAGSRIVVDPEGTTGPVQTVGKELCFVASDVPGIGYRTFWIKASKKRKKSALSAREEGDRIRLQNGLVQAEIDTRTGDLLSVILLESGRELLRRDAGGGNVLQLFGDEPSRWDAWNIGYTGDEWGSESAEVEIVDTGPVRATVRASRSIGSSEIVHDYVLHARQPLIEMRTRVDWNEERKLLKTAFHLSADGEVATYEIPYGTIDRPTRPATEAQRAKWEVPGQRWVDVTDRSSDFGLTLVDDSKYGYDVKEKTLRLTLLRAPKYPDPDADIGEHVFAYAVYPHEGDWRQAKSYRRGAEYNLPLEAIVVPRRDDGTLPPEQALVSTDADHVVLAALKAPREHRSTPALVLRIHEVEGRDGDVPVHFSFPLKNAAIVNLMEDPTAALTLEQSTVVVPVTAHGLTSILVEPAQP